ncbi:MAG TPA: HIT family protein [Roseiflexaceae bacterium]|nr:HIT family protein [Roseiflexaceae bacterium]
MSYEPCLTCRTLAGEINPPGGIVYDDSLWVVFLAQRPIYVAGQGFIALKRHCEVIGELTDAEAVALGRLVRLTARAYERAMQPVRVHFGLYAESVKHLHLHITPRMAYMPAGNIPLTIIGRWYALLARLGLRKPVPDEQVATLAGRLRTAFAER